MLSVYEALIFVRPLKHRKFFVNKNQLNRALPNYQTKCLIFTRYSVSSLQLFSIDVRTTVMAPCCKKVAPLFGLGWAIGPIR